MTDARSVASGQRDKGHWKDLTGPHFFVGSLLHEEELLGCKPASYRNDHGPTGLELANKRRRDMGSRGRNDNRVVGGVLRPPFISVPASHLNIFEFQLAEPLPRLIR